MCSYLIKEIVKLAYSPQPRNVFHLFNEQFALSEVKEIVELAYSPQPRNVFHLFNVCLI